jgi:hypothetical protein
MLPGAVAMSHFWEKTAILRETGGAGRCWRKGRRFQENCATRRSPEKGRLLRWVEKVVQREEVVGVWRRKRAGMVKRTMKKRVVQRFDWGKERDRGLKRERD